MEEGKFNICFSRCSRACRRREESSNAIAKMNQEQEDIGNASFQKGRVNQILLVLIGVQERGARASESNQVFQKK